MFKKKHEQVVIAIFDNETTAHDAVDTLKNWEKVNKEIKLGAIGAITKDGDKVKTHLGHKTGKGATVGVVLGIIAAALTGGISLLGGLIGGGVLGAIGGSFFKKSGGLTKEEIKDIGAHLDSGGTAVIVACDPHEVQDTSEHLTFAGGTVRNYEVPSDTVKETAQSIDHTGQVKSTAPVATAASTTATSSDDESDDVVVGVDDAGDVVAADAEGDVAVEDAEGDVAVKDAEGDVAASLADDLTRVEGIGPKIEEALYGVGIFTYIGLSATDPAALHDIIDDAGEHAPQKTIATWPAQATCAATGDWAGMKAVYEGRK